MSTEPVTPIRPYCYRCDKPAAMCLCARVPTLANRTGVQILQHAAERRHPIGTARLLKLALQRVDLHVLFSNHADGTCAPVPLPPRSGLLYPSADARDLAGLPEGEAPEHLVVIDGTWSQAHRLYRDNAWMRALPHYRLSPIEPSRYRIRREPRLECLSTLEAVAEAIRLLEPELAGVDALVTVFEQMIDDQVRATAESARPGRDHPASTRPRAASRPPFAPTDRVVVAYAEPIQTASASHDLRDLFQLAAVDLSSGAVFDAIVRHPSPPDAYHLAQLRLVDQDLLDAAPLDDVLAAFVAFLGAAPVVTAWHTCTHRMLGGLDAPGARHVLLKGAWANVTRARVPALDDVVRGLGVRPEPLAIRGRAGWQVSWARAVADALILGHQGSPDAR